jgi:hypothetical protein
MNALHTTTTQGSEEDICQLTHNWQSATQATTDQSGSSASSKAGRRLEKGVKFVLFSTWWHVVIALLPPSRDSTGVVAHQLVLGLVSSGVGRPL